MAAAAPWFKTRESDQEFIGGFPLALARRASDTGWMSMSQQIAPEHCRNRWNKESSPSSQTSSWSASPRRRPLSSKARARPNAGSTHWHAVVAFKKWAHYVRDNLHKRDRVEIAGYPHEREVRAKDGTTKTVDEIYVGYLKKLNKS
jgi:hypothetical protein